MSLTRPSSLPRPRLNEEQDPVRPDPRAVHRRMWDRETGGLSSRPPIETNPAQPERPGINMPEQSRLRPPSSRLGEARSQALREPWDQDIRSRLGDARQAALQEPGRTDRQGADGERPERERQLGERRGHGMEKVAPEDRPGWLEEAGRGFGMGVRGVRQGYHGTRAMLSGDEETREEQLGKFQQLGDKTQEKRLSVPEFTEIRGLGDLGRWVVGQGAAMVPIVGSIMAGGAAGGKAGAKAGAALGPKGAVAGGLIGSTIGSFSVGYKLYAGGLYGDIREQGGEHEETRAAALKYGAPASAVSIVVPLAATASVMGYLGKDFLKQRARNMALGAGLGSVTEGVAEGVAESFVIAGEEEVLGKTLTNEEKWIRIKNAAAVGGLMGTATGGLGAGGRRSGDIDTLIDGFADQLEAEAQNNLDRPALQQFLQRSLEGAEQLSPQQQGLLDYLRTNQAESNRDLNQASKQIQRIALDVAGRDEAVNAERMAELSQRQEAREITGDEAIELSALMANSPEAMRMAGDQVEAGAEAITGPLRDFAEVPEDAAEPVRFAGAALGENMDPEAASVLQDVEAHPDDRIAAAASVWERLTEVSPGLGDAFRDHAMRRITRRQPLVDESTTFYDSLRPLDRHRVDRAMEGQPETLGLPGPDGEGAISVPPANRSQVAGEATFFGGGFEAQAPASIRAEAMTQRNITTFLDAARERLRVARESGDREALMRAATEVRAGLNAHQEIRAGRQEQAKKRMEEQHQAYMQAFRERAAAEAPPPGLPEPEGLSERPLRVSPEGEARRETVQDAGEREEIGRLMETLSRAREDYAHGLNNDLNEVSKTLRELQKTNIDAPPDPARDELQTLVAKLGGLNIDEAKAQGFDPEQFKARVGKHNPFRRDGLSFDEMAEALSQYGLFAGRDYSANELVDMMHDSVRDSEVYAPAAAEHRGEIADLIEREAELAQAIQALESQFDRLTPQEVEYIAEMYQQLQNGVSFADIEAAANAVDYGTQDTSVFFENMGIIARARNGRFRQQTQGEEGGGAGRPQILQREPAEAEASDQQAPPQEVTPPPEQEPISPGMYGHLLGLGYTVDQIQGMNAQEAREAIASGPPPDPAPTQPTATASDEAVAVSGQAEDVPFGLETETEAERRAREERAEDEGLEQQRRADIEREYFGLTPGEGNASNIGQTGSQGDMMGTGSRSKSGGSEQQADLSATGEQQEARRDDTQRDIYQDRIEDIDDPAALREYVNALRTDAMTDERTGLGSNRAWINRDPKAYTASVDLDSLKWVNDNLGHAAGDRMIELAGEALRRAGFEGDAFHVSGDEFYVQADSADKLNTGLRIARDWLGNQTVGEGDNAVSPGFSYGIGQDVAAAEQELSNDKARREEAGERAARGERPGGDVGGRGQDRGSREAEADGQAAAQDRQGEGAERPEPVVEGEIDTAANEAATSPTNDTPAPAEGQEDAGSGSPAPTDRKPDSNADEVSVTSEKSANPNEPIEDFGEKIEGARKDYAQKLKDAGEKDVADVPLSESWPEPDYQKMIEGGTDPKAVALVRSLRDEVPNKPRAKWKVKGWAREVQTLRDAAMRILNEPEYAQRWREGLANKGDLEPVSLKAELYQAVGHDKSLKGITFSKTHWRIYKGEENVTKWIVSRSAKATAFGNMPHTLAEADTKEAAIEAFKQAHKTLEQTAEKAGKKVRFEIRAYRRGDNPFFIAKKIGRDVVPIKEGFASAKEAREHLTNNQAALEKTLEQMKDTPAHRKETNAPRVGADHRHGGDVTPEQFQDAFGFRGVQFGNYVEQGRRQQDLNRAYDALMDMAGILNLPPRALSLNGELGLAFGARGKGGKGAAAAHYERGRIVINLTKREGAGALAHEWFHSLDNYFSRMKGRKDEMLTEDQAVANASRGGSFVEDGQVRPEIIRAFGDIQRAVNESSLRIRSTKLDRLRSKPYWSTGPEMAARSFESYIIDKLQAQDSSNDYLANIVSEEYWEALAKVGMEQDGTYPYPEAAEMPAIRAVFDNFFQTVETKETDQGVALREEGDLYSIDVAQRRGRYNNKAQLDLFNDLNQASKQAPYDGTKTRPDTAEAQLEEGRSALRDLFRQLTARFNRRVTREESRGEISLLGARVYKNFVAGRPNQLLGQRVESPADLAALAQVYRDPRFETFRVILTKDGVAVNEVGITSRMPALVTFGDPEQMVGDINRLMDDTGADGYYLLHNHPSGSSSPSRDDFNATAMIQNRVAGFRGHVVIDHNEYSVIDTDLQSQKVEQDFGAVDFKSNPEQPHPLLGEPLFGPNDLVRAAKMLEIDSGKAVLISTAGGAGAEVNLVTSLPSQMLKDITANRTESLAAMRRMLRVSGSGGRTFVVLPMGANPVSGYRRLIEDGVVTDIVTQDGRSYAEENGPGSSRAVEASAKAMRISEADQGYQSSMGVDAIRRQATDLFRNVGLDRGGATPEVLATEADLPHVIRQQAEKDGATGQVDGVYHNGSLYVVADKVRSDAHLEQIIAHEGLGHFGARKLFEGEVIKAYDQLFFQLGGARGMKQRLKERGINFDPYLKTAERMGSKEQSFYLTDEFLAHMQQANAMDSLPAQIRRKVQELYGALRDMLKRRGLMSLASFNDADLAHVLRGMRESATRRKQAKEGRPVFMTAYHGSEPGAAFSRGGHPFTLAGTNPSDNTDTGLRAQAVLARNWTGDAEASVATAIQEAKAIENRDVVDWLRTNKDRVSGRPMFSLTNQQGGFASFVDQALSQDTNPGKTFTLGDTPEVFMALGANQLPVEINASVIQKAVGGKHSLDAETVKQIPEQLDDPVMVFDSATTGGSLVALTELTDTRGEPVVVAVHLDKRAAHHTINSIATIHAKDGAGKVVNWIETGKLAYRHRKKSRSWLQSVPLQLRWEGVKNDRRGKVITDKSIVKPDSPMFSRAGTAPAEPPIGFAGPRIESARENLLRVRGIFESAADVLRRTPGLEHLGEAVRVYYDRTGANRGATARPERVAGQALSRLNRKERKRALNDFASHRAAVENGRTAEAERVLKNANPVLNTLIDSWQEIADITGDMARDAGVMVKDAKTGGWRPMGKVKNFWPRQFSEDVQKALDAPHKHPEMWNRLVEAVYAQGGHDTMEDAANYLISYRNEMDADPTQNDYFAGIEKGRSEPLPEIFYDYSWESGLLYKEAWADRLAQIQAFGQSYGQNKDLFDKTLEGVRDDNTRQYIGRIRQRAYNEKVNEPIQQFMQTMNALATGIQLGNPGTAILNLIGGTSLTMQAYGAGRTLRELGGLVKSWKSFKNQRDLARDLGVLKNDYLNIMHDSERSGVPKWLRETTGTLLKVGGYTPTEHFIRTHAMVTGMSMLRDAVKTLNTRPGSKKAARYAKWLQDNGFDVDTLVKENGEGPYTDRFVRYTVNLTQGSYRIDQTPVYVDTPIGRFLFKYQKFGTQLTRMFWMNHLKPFVDTLKGGERVTYTVGGKEYSDRLYHFMPILRFMALGAATGMLLMDWREELFGYQNKAPTLDELERALEDDDKARALALGAERAWQGFIGIGGFGVVSNYMQMAYDVADRQRVKNPLDPPGLAPLKSFAELSMRLFEQGGQLSARDIDNFIQGNIAIYRTAKRASAGPLAKTGWQEMQIEAAKKDASFVKKMTRRYAEEAGLTAKRRSTGRFGATENSILNNQVYEAVLVGDIGRTRILMRERLLDRDRYPTPEDRRNAMRSLRASIRAREPSRVGVAPSDRERVAFLRWAKNNTTAEEYARIRRVADDYRRNAIRAGLL